MHFRLAAPARLPHTGKAEEYQSATECILRVRSHSRVPALGQPGLHSHDGQASTYATAKAYIFVGWCHGAHWRPQWEEIGKGFTSLGTGNQQPEVH